MLYRHRLFVPLAVLAIMGVVPAVRAQESAAVPANGSQCPGAQAVWLGGENASMAEAPLQEMIRLSGPETRAFRLAEPGQVRIEARSDSRGDPSVRLFDSSGAEIGYNDDMERSLEAQLEMDLAAGEYCVTVEDSTENRDVMLQVGLQSQQALNESGTLACGPDTATSPLVGGALDAALAQGAVSVAIDAGRNAYLRFSVKEPTLMSLRASAAEGDVDPQIALFDTAGRLLAANDDADGRDARLDFTPGLAPGDYCIGVGPVTPSTGMIRLSAQKLDLQSFVRQAHMRGELPPMDGSYPLQELSFSGRTQIVMQAGAANWFSFDLDQRSVIAVNTMGSISGVDTKLVLFDAEGQMLQEADDTETSKNATIPALMLQPGRYFLALTDVGTNGQIAAPARPVGLMAEKFTSTRQD